MSQVQKTTANELVSGRELDWLRFDASLLLIAIVLASIQVFQLFQ